MDLNGSWCLFYPRRVIEYTRELLALTAVPLSHQCRYWPTLKQVKLPWAKTPLDFLRYRIEMLFIRKQSWASSLTCWECKHPLDGRWVRNKVGADFLFLGVGVNCRIAPSGRLAIHWSGTISPWTRASPKPGAALISSSLVTLDRGLIVKTTPDTSCGAISWMITASAISLAPKPCKARYCTAREDQREAQH